MDYLLNALRIGSGHFTVTSLQRILTNKAYIGLRELDKSKGKTEVFKANWPAIIDLELFNQVQDRLREKLKELEVVKSKLTVEQSRLSKGSVNKTELLFKIKRAINSLEKAPPEDRRPIYSNLIKFAELYPTKVRLGVYAPALPTAISNFATVSGLKRAGSCTESFGAP